MCRCSGAGCKKLAVGCSLGDCAFCAWLSRASSVHHVFHLSELFDRKTEKKRLSDNRDDRSYSQRTRGTKFEDASLIQERREDRVMALKIGAEAQTRLLAHDKLQYVVISDRLASWLVFETHI